MPILKATLMLLIGIFIGIMLEGRILPADRIAEPVQSIPTVEMVRNLSELTTLRVDLADVEVTRISGWCGQVEAALLIKGDFAIATDLGGARFRDVDTNARTAVLMLPRPAASPPRLDHDRTRLVLVRQSGLWQMIPGDEAYVAVTNRAYQQAQQALAATSQQPAHQQAACRQAEQVVRAFFNGIGWNVDIRWT